MPVESLWTVLDRVGLPPLAAPASSTVVAVHDACTTRYDSDIQDGVRNLLGKLGVQVSELKDNRSLTTCCGYGGHMAFANPEVAGKVVHRRIHDSEADYVTYCAMCRDNFAARGKRTLHLLDLICASGNGDPAERRGPGYSQRRENRVKLKNRMLKDLWGETVAAKESSTITLRISDEMRSVLEERQILDEDIREVIDFAERSGKKLLNRDNGHFVAHHKPISVTYWVEYTITPNGAFIIHNAYSHRMEITEEAKP